MRIKDLDFLRGLAILGVLFRHSAWDNRLARTGWIGVDLFFVLSGFLVSGLLFQEYKKYGKVRIGRFLIRRGFKIYPTFYIFLIVAFLFGTFISDAHFERNNLLSEVFFMQSYFPGCFIHTWSLAIEEHFYLLLSLFVWVAIQRGWIENRFLMIIVLSGSIVLVFLLRFQYVFARQSQEYIPIFYSHLRMDGLLLGVLISFLYYFQTWFREFLQKYGLVLPFFALVFILPVFWLKPGGFFMNTLGLNMMHIGFGIFVALAATGKLFDTIARVKLLKHLFNSITYIGIYSYSIYVWHLFFTDLIEKVFHAKTGGYLYLIVAIAGGIILSLLIEQTFLKVRNKYFR
jgi:peptidoglycan/LPS O-acetylase OafA/YrhL